MQPNWDTVKKITLWNYENLMQKLCVVTGYPTIWHAYNHTVPRAAIFAMSLFPHSNIETGEYPSAIIRSFERLQTAGISDWESLLSKISTRADCANFVAEHPISFEELIEVLNYLLRFGFPFKTATRELLDHENPQEMVFYKILKAHLLMNSFDLLEQGNTAAARRNLADLTGLQLDFVTRIVHRADIGRLPYARRKTILALCGAGYDNLRKIAGAGLPQMEADLDAYFQRTQGKPWENFKSVIVLRELIVRAQALPGIVSE